MCIKYCQIFICLILQSFKHIIKSPTFVEAMCGLCFTLLLVLWLELWLFKIYLINIIIRPSFVDQNIFLLQISSTKNAILRNIRKCTKFYFFRAFMCDEQFFCKFSNQLGLREQTLCSQPVGSYLHLKIIVVKILSIHKMTFINVGN